MIIIALDLGCETGIAMGNLEELSMGGVKKWKKSSPVGDSRFVDFYRWLRNIVANTLSLKQEITIVAEKTNQHMPGYDGPRIHFGMQAVIDIIQAENPGINVIRVSALTIKKYWLGSAKLRGKASKIAMVKKTQELYPKVTNDNEADAIALYHYTIDNLINKGELK